MKIQQWTSLLLLVVYITTSLPIQGMCVERSANMHSIARDILYGAKTGSRETIAHNFQKLATTFATASNTVEEGRKFIQSFVREVNAQYGTHLTVEDAYIIAQDHIFQLQIPQYVRETLFAALQCYAGGTLATSFPQSEQSPTLFRAVLNDQQPACRLNMPITHLPVQARYLLTKNKSNKELELPSKMAIGFACVLAGALVCIIPGGQAAGIWMMGTGATLALDGLSEGERPYYRDPETGEITPI